MFNQFLSEISHPLTSHDLSLCPLVTDTFLASLALFGVGLKSAVKFIIPTIGIQIKPVSFLTNVWCDLSLTNPSLGFPQLPWTSLPQAFQVTFLDMLTVG